MIPQTPPTRILSRTFALTVASVGALIALAACTHDLVAPANAPATRAAPLFSRGGNQEPEFLNAAADAPTIANPVISFTVTRSEDKIVRMYYHARAGHSDSSVFAEFRVQPQSLASWPDGHPIADGEIVTITMTLVDADRGIIEFQPSGLRFSARRPARLKVSYRYANRDVNGDGVIDARDAALMHTLHMICRETDDGPWFRIPSQTSPDLDEVESPISGFSGYALDVG
jgi:hypothetical protein